MEQIPEGEGRPTIHMFGGKAFEAEGQPAPSLSGAAKARPVGERAGEPMRMELKGRVAGEEVSGEAGTREIKRSPKDMSRILVFLESGSDSTG